MDNLKDNSDYGMLRKAIKEEIDSRLLRFITCKPEELAKEQGFINGMMFVNDYLVRD